MTQLNGIINRLENDPGIAYALIRIFLGIGLFTRGLLFFTHPDIFSEFDNEMRYLTWHPYIAVGHIIGGISVGLGFQTRIGALLQIPILIGAIFIIHINQSLVLGNQSLEFSLLVLFLLNIYLLFGSGHLSLDQYFKKKTEVNLKSVI